MTVAIVGATAWMFGAIIWGSLCGRSIGDDSVGLAIGAGLASLVSCFMAVCQIVAACQL